jgi:hypothetical protein
MLEQDVARKLRQLQRERDGGRRISAAVQWHGPVSRWELYVGLLRRAAGSTRSVRLRTTFEDELVAEPSQHVRLVAAAVGRDGSALGL